jgi:RimJ/RimL family protein N-acetyltransferase
MLNHAFKFVDTVIFHIGSNNIRSQKAIEKLGAKKIGEIEMEYYGEEQQLNYVYQIIKEEWQKLSNYHFTAK